MYGLNFKIIKPHFSYSDKVLNAVSLATFVTVLAAIIAGGLIGVFFILIAAAF